MQANTILQMWRMQLPSQIEEARLVPLIIYLESNTSTSLRNIFRKAHLLSNGEEEVE